MYIAIEGLDGSGGTTQLDRLATAFYLREPARPVVRTREPSDLPVGKLIRALLAGQREAAGEIGMDRPLSSYTQQEALRLINAVVTTYVEVMVQEHERSKYPPVRMQLDQSPLS